MNKIEFNNELEEKLENIYEKMQKQISELKDTWHTIPGIIREQINQQFNESYQPDYCLRWLETAVDDMYRNSDSIFKDLKDTLEDEEDLEP